MSYVRTAAAGFVVPLDLAVWRAQTTATETAPVPGVPVPAARADGRYPPGTLTVSGPQPAGTTIDVEVVQPGYGGSAGLVRSTDGGTTWLGDDTPLALVDLAPVAAATGGNPTRKHGHGVVLSDGTRVVVYAHDATGPTVHSIRCSYRAPADSAWTAAVIRADSGAASFACLLVLDDDTLICASWIVDSGGLAQLALAQSMDAGATWSPYSAAGLPSAVDTSAYTLGRLRLARLRDEWALFAHVTSTTAAAGREEVRHYASSDEGATWTLVATLTGAALPDVVVYDGRLIVAYADVVSTLLETRVLGSAWTPLDGAPTTSLALSSTAMITVASHAVTVGECALVTAPSGVYLLGRDVTSQAACLAAAALGSWPTARFVVLGSGPANSGEGSWFIANGPDAANDYPSDFSAVAWRGGILVYCGLTGAASSLGEQLYELRLGGATSVPLPRYRTTRPRRVEELTGYERVYVASDTPDAAYAWTATGTGAASVTTSPGELVVMTTADQLYYTRTETSALNEIRVSGTARWISGGGLTTRGIYVSVRCASTGVGFEAELRIAETGVRLFDVLAVATIDTATLDTSAGFHFILSVDLTGKCFAAVAPLDSTSPDRVYVVLANGTTLTDDAGAAGTDNITGFGHRASDTASSAWRVVGLNYDDDYAGTLASGLSSPDELLALPTATATPVWLGAQVSGSLDGGPFRVGDAYEIPPDSGYPTRAVLPRAVPSASAVTRGGGSPSPLAEARWSAAGGRVAFRVPERVERRYVRGLLAVHVERPNWPTAVVQRESAGAWTTVATIDGRITSVALLRKGSRLVVNPAGSFSTTTYLRAGELAGGYVVWQAATTKIRPIRWHSAGRLGLDGDGPLPVIELDPDSIDGTEPTSGVVDIWPPSRTLLVPWSATQEAEGFSLYWSAAVNTYEGYLRAGAVVIGEVYGVALPEWGTTATRSRGLTEIIDLPAGQRLARVRGGSRWIYELPWTWDAPLWRAQASPLAADAWTWQTGGPVAGATGMEPDILQGLVEEYEGGAIPGVYVPYIEGDGGTRTLIGRRAGIYGRLVSQSGMLSLAAGSEVAPVMNAGSHVWEQEL